VDKKPESTKSRPLMVTSALWASAWVALGACLIVGASDARGRSAQLGVVLSPPAREASLSGSAPPNVVARARPIQDIRVGDRVLTNAASRGLVPSETRGVLPSSEPLLDAEDVDQETWRQVDLAMPEGPGGDLKMALLRPRWWVQAVGAKAGGTIGLDLPEMGAVGTARVVGVSPCPPLKRGRGKVVTGTYTHSGATVLDVRVEGLDQPIGATPQHPFYSASRHRYVAAEHLVTGERLVTAVGESLVTSVTRRPGEHWVYNLEVHGDHVYRVSGLGVLVHNTSPGYPRIFIPNPTGTEVPPPPAIPPWQRWPVVITPKGGIVVPEPNWPWGVPIPKPTLPPTPPTPPGPSLPPWQVIWPD
jgi:Pretoxin HINT domain